MYKRHRSLLQSRGLEPHIDYSNSVSRSWHQEFTFLLTSTSGDCDRHGPQLTLCSTLICIYWDAFKSKFVLKRGAITKPQVLGTRKKI